MANFVVNMGGRATGLFNEYVKSFYSTETSVLDGPVASIGQGRDGLAAAACGNYFLAMGGKTENSTPVSAINVYEFNRRDDGSYGIREIQDPDLALSEPRYNLAAGTLGNYILALGGMESHGLPLATVDIFQVTADGVEPAPLESSLSIGRSSLAAASSGDYLLAMGGLEQVSSVPQVNGPSDAIDVFRLTGSEIQRVETHSLRLSEARYNLAATTCGEYIFAMGGYNSPGIYSDAVDVFRVTSNGVVGIQTDLRLSVPRDGLAAAACGDYVFAMGGYAGGMYSNVVDVFKVTANGMEKVNIPLVLKEPRDSLTAGSCGNFVLAMGGRGREDRISSAIDVFEVKQN